MNIYPSRSNNTNKLSPQEPSLIASIVSMCSNNTNKLSPQEQLAFPLPNTLRSNNTNKLSPQEHHIGWKRTGAVQIIQINLVLKNNGRQFHIFELFK